MSEAERQATEDMFVAEAICLSAAAGLSAEDQANLAAGSDSVAVQQEAQDSNGDAVVAGAAGAAAFLAHSTRAALRDAARRDDAS